MPTRDKPRIVLHIGGAKCGSSAIQAYLAVNSDILATRGVCVPGVKLDLVSEVTGEQIWFFEDRAVSGDLEGIRTAMKELLAEAWERSFSDVVISAENLCNHPELAAIFASVLTDFEARIVFYVRRQDDFLISSWQQWNLKRFGTIEEFLAQRVGKDARWLAMILPWAEAFGDEHVTVRPFVREMLHDRDVISDFCRAIGVSRDGLASLAKNANPSFDEALARLAHRVRDVFDGPHDNRFYDVMVRLLGDPALKRGSASSLLDLSVRREIYAHYREENAALRARFLPDLNAPALFEPPCPADVIQRSEADKLSEDIAMLTRAVYALASRLEGRNA